MTRRLAKTRPSPPAPAPWSPPKPPSEHFTPAWVAERHTASGSPCHVGSIVTGIASGVYRLPRFQRPWRWSDEDTLYLLDSILAGYHTGQLLLWERHDLPASTERFGEIEVTAPAGRGRLVVDGQQRLGAIASAALGQRFAFHLLDGRFAVGASGPWWCPAGLVMCTGPRSIDWIVRHAREHRIDEHQLLGAFGDAIDSLCFTSMYTVTMDPAWPLDRVIESYRRLNTTGVRMSPEDIEAGLRLAVEP